MTVRPGRIAAVVVGAVAALGALAVGAVVVVVRLADRPAEVPADFRTPVALPAGDPLPAGAVLFDSDRRGSFDLYVLDAGSSDARPLVTDPARDLWWPRLSPDRRTVVYYATPAGVHDRDFAQTALWAVASDGGDPVLLRPAGLDGWTFQGHAEWSPDGRELVMFGGSRLSPQIQVTDALGRHPRAVTDRPGTNIDPSWTADGEAIVFIGCPQSICTEGDYEVYRVPVAGGEPTRLTTDGLRDHDPAVHPSGQLLAWLVQTGEGVPGTWDVRIADADGRGGEWLAGDGGITSRPTFAPDGTRVLVHRIPPGGDRFQLYAASVSIGGDGTVVLGPLELLAGEQPGANEYPSA